MSLANCRLLLAPQLCCEPCLEQNSLWVQCGTPGTMAQSCPAALVWGVTESGLLRRCRRLLKNLEPACRAHSSWACKISNQTPPRNSPSVILMASENWDLLQSTASCRKLSMCHAADTHLFPFQEPGRSRQHCRAVLGYPGFWWWGRAGPHQWDLGPGFKERANIQVAPFIKGLCCLEFGNKWALALCHLYCPSGFAVLQFVPLILPVKESPLQCNAKKLPLAYSWLQMSKLASSTSRGGKFSEKKCWDIEMNFCQQWTQPFSVAHLALFHQYCTRSVCVHRLGWDMQAMAGEGHGKSIFKYREYLIIQYERWESFTGCNSQKRAIPWVNWHFWAHLSLAMEKPECGLQCLNQQWFRNSSKWS